MNIKKSLKDFYNKEAKKYYFTRNKHRSDGEIILDEIKKNPKKTISILEFGCGGGRFIKFLNNNLENKNINYIGVDLSEKLLELARKDNPKNIFICDDIINYIRKVKQESLDFIIGVASFQHIPNNKERLLIMKIFYKTLKYNGKLIMTNRSLSKRFIKKHTKVILKSILKYIYTLGIHNRRNLQIPRENGNKKYFRFYHMFSKKELEYLGKQSGFKINKLTYIDRHGQYTKKLKKSNNTIFIGKKDIC